MYVQQEAAKRAFSLIEEGQYLAFAYKDGKLTPAARPCSSEPAAKRSALVLCESLGPYHEGYVVERRPEQEPDELNEYYPFWVFEAVEWVNLKKRHTTLPGRFIRGWPFHVNDLFAVELGINPRSRPSALASS